MLSDANQAYEDTPGTSPRTENGLLLAITDNDIIANDLSDPENSLSQSSSSADSGSVETQVGEAWFNTPVFLLIDPIKVEGQIKVHFTSQRPGTHLGATQGDHVIAHRLVLEYCVSLIIDKRLIDVASVIKNAFVELLPDIEEEEKWPTELPKLVDYNSTAIEKLNSLDDGGEAVQDYKRGVRYKRSQALVRYLSAVLSCYNNLEDVVHKKTENKTNSEGSDIATSILALKAINHFKSLGSNPSDEIKQRFFTSCLEPNHEFTRGMIRIFRKEVKVLRGEHKNSNDFFSIFSDQSSAKLIGELIEKLFDYPFSPQTNKLDLIILSKRCLSMALTTFPNLANSCSKETINESFLNSLFENQKWKNSPLKVEEIVQSINDSEKKKLRP